MEKSLVEAALSGSGTTLNALIQADPLILDKVSLTCFNDTPLHIAALRGHLGFVTAILCRKPQFATVSDSFGRSPLHLACAEGHVEIVKILLQARPKEFERRDQDGRTPFDLAALNDRVEVLDYLLQNKPGLASSGSWETTLHLCVRYNSIGALKLLVDRTSMDEVAKYVDEDGNTLLHLAVIHQQIDQTIKYLLGEVGVGEKWSSLNKNGFTAVDVLDHCPRDWRSLEIQDILTRAGVRRAKDLHIQPKTSLPNPIAAEETIVPSTCSPLAKVFKRFFLNIWNNYLKNDSDWVDKARGNLMIVATLTATISFQAGINPPGGVWQETKDGHVAGTSIMADNPGANYQIFMFCNSISLTASTTIILFVMSGIPLKTKMPVGCLMFAMCVSIVCLSYAYHVAVWGVLTAIDTLTRIAIMLVFAASVGIILLAHAIRFIVWLIKLMKKLWKFLTMIGRCLKGCCNENPANSLA